jgi:hypothetical protein
MIILFSFWDDQLVLCVGPPDEIDVVLGWLEGGIEGEQLID